MRKVVNKATSKKLSVCVLLILGTLVLDHLNTMITFFSKDGDGQKKLKDVKKGEDQRDYVFNYIEMFLYIIILFTCLISFFA